MASLNPDVELIRVSFISFRGHGRLDNLQLHGNLYQEPVLHFVHTDHLGSPLALTDSNGNVQWKGSYDPYGNLTIEVNNLDQSQRFPGQRKNSETGLHYNYFRDYDPELGRYLQSDPIGLRGGINTYGYVGGNPVNAIDPLGLHSTDAHNSLIITFGKANGFTQSQIKAMQDGSKFADNFMLGKQDADMSFIHAMTSSAHPNKYKACLESKKYVKEKLDKYNELLGEGKEYLAYHSMGQGLHAVMDNTSPAHTGFQYWDNSQISRHGDFPRISVVVPSPMGGSVAHLSKGSEENLSSLLANPELIEKTVNDMNKALKGDYFDCQCYVE